MSTKRFTTSLNSDHMVTMSKSIGKAYNVAASKTHTTSSLLPGDEFVKTKHARQNVSMNAISRNRSIPAPVMEGFDNAPSAYIAPIGSGYDSPKLVPAKVMADRYSNPTPPQGLFPKMSNFRKNGVHDYRYGSASKKMNKLKKF